jgi:predicted dehydrogenase/aryl-alcohol dehydrogenase-like predicted oxidoreductase
MRTLRWGIIGPGTIAHNFADGLKEAPSGALLAIASRDDGRRASFGETYGIAGDKRYSDYAALAADPDVDAIYISTPHPFHAEQAIMAMRAGKPVLCEKPAGMTASQVVAITEVAAQEGVFFMEAFMYRCHPQIARMLDILRSGEIGDILHIRAALGYRAPFDPGSRAYSKALGGGGILDVGCYPVSFARLVAGAAIAGDFDNPSEVAAVGTIGRSGVDEVAHALLQFPSGATAECAAAVARTLDNTATITGSLGSLHLPDPWVPGRNAGPSDATIVVTVGGHSREEEIRQAEHLFAFEAELASRAILEKKAEPDPPAVSWIDSIGNAETLDRWRHAIGYTITEETPTANKALHGVLPRGLVPVPRLPVAGVGRPVSRLILGCDNKDTIADGAIVWDAWMEAGGNAFDTGFVYGGGRHEAVLGEWIRNRGVAGDVVVVVKGAHTPYCTPRAVAAQLDISLDRLGLDRAPIYILHRDNPDVPVGEFVDALNRLKESGRIGIFGGSNWTVERFRAANDYAATNGLEPLRILNNNLSLAVMERPVWPGCVTSNTPDTLNFLRENNVMHLSWSSQARGYFLPEALRDRLPTDTNPETCFASGPNEERRRRAATLAAEQGVSAHNIAMAWVLAQPFPSFALVGPRSSGEIVTTLPALGVDLGADEVAWLNLERDER